MNKDNLTSSFLFLREKLYRSALRFLQNDEDAKDAVQDTFFNLFKNGEVKSDLEAHNKLFAVLKNICIDKLRKPLNKSLEDTDVEKNFFISNSYDESEVYEKFLTKGLTKIQMKIYHLMTYQCMEYEEISKTLQMSIEAVRMNMTRARKKMRENIKRYDL